MQLKKYFNTTAFLVLALIAMALLYARSLGEKQAKAEALQYYKLAACSDVTNLEAVLNAAPPPKLATDNIELWEAIKGSLVRDCGGQN